MHLSLSEHRRCEESNQTWDAQNGCSPLLELVIMSSMNCNTTVGRDFALISIVQNESFITFLSKMETVDGGYDLERKDRWVTNRQRRLKGGKVKLF